MNKAENLLITASGKCAEISENISNVLRFGKNGKTDNTDNTDNTYGFNIVKEFIQLQAVIDMMMDNGIIDKISLEESRAIYWDKVSSVSRSEREIEIKGNIDELTKRIEELEKKEKEYYGVMAESEFNDRSNSGLHNRRTEAVKK